VLRFVENGVSFSLEQSGEYPYSDKVTFKITTSRKADLTLHFRIPVWSRNPQIDVNGQPFPLAVTKGFASVHRTWKTGDVLNLLLPATLRLEPISAAHPETAALLYGPLVLFALTSAPPSVTRAQALAAKRDTATEWSIATDGFPLRLVPFTGIGDATYATYLTYAAGDRPTVG